MRKESHRNPARYVEIPKQNIGPVSAKVWFFVYFTFVFGTDLDFPRPRLSSAQVSLHNKAVEKTERTPTHDVAFTKSRYQHK